MQARLGRADFARLDEVGAVCIESALHPDEQQRLKAFAETFSNGRPGVRLGNLETLGWLLDKGVAGCLARSVIGPNARAVRAILFDKTPSNNWALGWHQDRTIAVAGRVEVPGFANWNIKADIHHVEPPFELIERMVTARIHLDDVDDGNAPLLIAPGSHRLGRIPEAEIDTVVTRCDQTSCLAQQGDIWLYRTAIVHASKRADRNRRRRVFQVDFSGDDLPGGLRWYMAA